MSKAKIAVIISSTRPTRFGDKPAAWIADLAQKTGYYDVAIVDLKDYPLPLFDAGDAQRAGATARYDAALARTAALAVDAASQLREADGNRRDAHALALQFRDRLVPLQATIVGQNLLRYNGMLASAFELLADAREQARTVQQAIAAQRDFWLADAAFQAATLGVPILTDTPEPP